MQEYGHKSELYKGGGSGGERLLLELHNQRIVSALLLQLNEEQVVASPL